MGSVHLICLVETPEVEEEKPLERRITEEMRFDGMTIQVV